MNRYFRHHAGARSACLASVWALGLGCSVSADDEATDTDAAESPAHRSAALTHAGSCDDLLEQLQRSASERVVALAVKLRHPPEVYAGEPGIVVTADVIRESALAPGGSASANTDLAGAESSGFSDTTLQIDDVDEPDVIKTDGDDLYLLQGDSLVKVRAWPPEQTQTLAAAAIEGYPHDMFVSGGKAIVFSSVYKDVGNPEVRQDYYYNYPSYTKLTVFDVEAETPRVLRESYLEGNYVASRRHDGIVRAVIQDNYKVPSFEGAYIEYFTPFGRPYRQADIDAQVDAWLERTLWGISETDLDSWLPRQFTVVAGEPVAAERDCADYFEPSFDLSRSGVTQIFSLSVGSDTGTTALPAATVLARAERVYANDRVVLLAQTEYGGIETNYAQTTHLHRFDLEGERTTYAASGTVPGYVQSQFSLDEYQGTIRVSTTESRWNGDNEPLGPINHVFTLGTSGNALSVLGQTEVLGENQQIFATRFIGNLGYVVTYRQIDPLFVIDLSDPSSPEVVGELHIPGFSNFLYPLDAQHLFAIGRDTTEQGTSRGIALQIFDIADPSSPSLTHKYVYSGDNYSEASIDHRGMTFHPDGGRIAFPLTNYATGQSAVEVVDLDATRGFVRRGALAPQAPDYTLEECVVLLGYGEGALEGPLGDEIAASPEFADYLLAQCRGYEQMRRGVLRADVVYGVSTSAVYAQSVGQLGAGPAIRAALPPSSFNGFYLGGAIADSAGAAGAAGASGVDLDETGAGGSAGAAGAGGAGAEPSEPAP